MKHRIIFEENDFDGSGQLLIRNSSPDRNDRDWGFAASVAYKVGWSSRPKGVENGIHLIALTDGMVLEFETTEEFLDYLNKDDMGFRPMTANEIFKVMQDVGNRFPEA